MNRAGVNSLQLSVTITKLKQQITNLQNQIAAQQAVYIKQQQASNIGGGGGSGGVGGVGGGIGNHGLGGGGGGGVSGMGGGIGGASADYLRAASNQHDPINSLQGPFADMTMNKVSKFIFLCFYVSLYIICLSYHLFVDRTVTRTTRWLPRGI